MRAGAIRTILIFGVLAVTRAAYCQDSRALELRSNVVKIEGAENGFGFIVSEQNGKLFIVTAGHVVVAKPGEVPPRLKVFFFNDQGKSYDAEVLRYKDDHDLALLGSEVPHGLTWKRDCLSDPEQTKRGTLIWFIGKDSEWFVPVAGGELNEGVDADSWLHAHIPQLTLGSSGGPWVTATGIIAMVKGGSTTEDRGLSVKYIETVVKGKGWGYPWDLRNATAPAVMEPPPATNEIPLAAKDTANSGTEKFAPAEHSALEDAAQQLASYYTNLSSQVENSITLEDAQEVVMNLPARPEAVAALDTTKNELEKRGAMARALGNLASAYARLANSKAATDTSAQATVLANACNSIKPLPGGPAIPDSMAAARLSIEQSNESIYKGNLRKSSEAIAHIVSAIEDLFAGERGLYESTNSDRVMVAGQIAQWLIKREELEITPTLAAALKPITLPAKVQSVQMRELVTIDIKRTRDRQIVEFNTNTDSLLLALRTASQQIRFAAGKH